MSIKEEITAFTAGALRESLLKIDSKLFEAAEEIRVRADRPISIKTARGIKTLSANGKVPSYKDIAQTMEIIAGYSLFAYNEEIKNGYITLKGGHRVGLGGRVVLGDKGVIDIRHISSLNIRISREIRDCGQGVLPCLLKDGQVLNTMLISPPGRGKTTLLRDLIRLISREGINITVVDERSEICNGNADWGPNTDILEGCPKVLGMKMALRSMAPGVIAVDEIGSRADAGAIWEMTVSGVSVLCTAHGNSLEDLLKRGELTDLVSRKLIRRFVFLENKDGKTGNIKTILDEDFNQIQYG